MSPLILRKDGYRVIIYFNDHEPAHVHVKKDRNEARVQLNPVEMMNNHGFKPKEIKKITKIVKDNQSLLLDKWDTMHPQEEEADDDVTE